MSGAISFLVLGSLLLVVLFLFLRHSSTIPAKIKRPSEAHEALSVLQSELLPDWFVDRLFSEEDWNFARNQDAPEVPGLFDRERKTVALSWLKETRRHVSQLMDFHVRLARQRPDLKPSVEAKLTLEYLQFRLACSLLAGMIRTIGPCQVRSLAGYAVNLATHLGAVSEKVLTSLDDAIAVAE